MDANPPRSRSLLSGARWRSGRAAREHAFAESSERRQRAERRFLQQEEEAHASEAETWEPERLAGRRPYGAVTPARSSFAEIRDFTRRRFSFLSRGRAAGSGVSADSPRAERDDHGPSSSPSADAPPGDVSAESQAVSSRPPDVPHSSTSLVPSPLVGRPRLNLPWMGRGRSSPPMRRSFTRATVAPEATVPGAAGVEPLGAAQPQNEPEAEGTVPENEPEAEGTVPVDRTNEVEDAPELDPTVAFIAEAEQTARRLLREQEFDEEMRFLQHLQSNGLPAPPMSRDGTTDSEAIPRPLGRALLVRRGTSPSEAEPSREESRLEPTPDTVFRLFFTLADNDESPDETRREETRRPRRTDDERTPFADSLFDELMGLGNPGGTRTNPSAEEEERVRRDLRVLNTRLHGLRLILALSQQDADADVLLPIVLSSFGATLGADLSALSAELGITIPPPLPHVPRAQIAQLMPHISYGDACASHTHFSSECSVCMSDFEPDSSVRVLPCKHVFHMGCIDQWFERSNFCPNCKGVVTEASS